ncbi:helix-turn-helix domain-containing protein [Desulfovibrio sp. OttesenSCG-928-O18]|nr:helix-turn-helix domain-containing protein [Desulfovibrio sp. OttesenSCG-928-O18]
MVIPFDAFFQRVCESTDVATQMDLARALDVNRSAITQAKNRDAVPSKWILALSRRYNLSPDWLEYGKGEFGKKAPASIPGQILPLPEAGLETVMVPKVRATLCAGGGSFELEAVPVSEHPLPRAWLSRMGSPNAMVFMDVIGNSMEPGIRDGDMVLVDQAAVEPTAKSILAVGYEDAIYIKRLERQANGFLLVSDNPDYAPIRVAGDEMASFRVIGKVVWLCRDCRYA